MPATSPHRLVTGPRTAWVVALVPLLLALAIIGGVGEGEREQVSTDSLPAGYDSTAGTALLDELPAETTTAAVVLFTADSGDLSVADDTSSADFADARRDIEEYQAGRAALARLDSGDYGVCADCGEDIPAERLQAQPFAIRCTACQERRERATAVHRSTM